jgi:P-type Cu+ transporter
MNDMTDPICGMTVEPERAAGNHVYNGQTYYFCSQHCLTEFKKDPEKFLKSPPAAQTAHRHGHSHPHTSSQAAPTEKKEPNLYVCPMDPEVRESKLLRTNCLHDESQ